jgi:hypothetical protein
MQLVPFEHMLQRSTRKLASNRPALDIYRDLEFPILRVEVGRDVIVVIQRDHDSKKPRNLGHGGKLPLGSQRFNGITTKLTDRGANNT